MPPARRALVTGANGFVGANLVRRLVADGHEVVAMTSPRADLWRLAGHRFDGIEVDIRDRSAVRRLVREASPHWVFHLAAHGAYSWQRNHADIMAVNVLGSVHVVDAAIEAGVTSIVLAGSSSEYGFKNRAPREDEALQPSSAYAVAKAGATLYGQSVARETDRHICTLRLYSAYGPWEDPRRLVPTLVAHCREGRLPPLVHPDTARDFVHVDDVCTAFVRAAARTELPRGAVLNVGSGHETKIKDIVALARAIFSVEAEPQWETMSARSWDTSAWVADPSQARAELAWQTTTDLEHGLRTFGNWMESVPASVAERYRVGRER
jgi:nucleoside-diphosphate-sugar epimerase